MKSLLARTIILCTMQAITWSLPAAGRADDAPAKSDSSTVLSDQQIQQALQPFHTRGLTRKNSADAGQSVNLNIPFENNSSKLQPQASAQLQQLQSALESPGLSKNRFMVAGHTDSKGNPERNQQLSVRRAESVKIYLVGRGIDPARLETTGFGSDKPLTAERPDDPANRRVEIRVLAPAPTTP